MSLLGFYEKQTKSSFSVAPPAIIWPALERIANEAGDATEERSVIAKNLTVERHHRSSMMKCWCDAARWPGASPCVTFG
jgi:hypothetical protein